MFEPKIKENRRWYLVFDDTKIRFQTKNLAIFIGKVAYERGYNVRLIEEYDLFDYTASQNKGKHIDHQEFDRTILITL